MSKTINQSVRKNASTILTIFGCVGVVVTAYLAVKATPKAQERLKDALEEKGEKLTKLETLTNGGISYIPAATSGICTIMCICGANAMNRRQIESLIAAYNMLLNYSKQYRDALIDIYGKEADEKIHAALTRVRSDYHYTDNDTPDEKCVWVDDYSGASIEAYERAIMDAEYHLNRNFTLKGYATFNEWLGFLGIDPIIGGDDIGWSMDNGVYWVDFEHYPVNHSSDDSGPTICCISTPFEPEILPDLS